VKRYRLRVPAAQAEPALARMLDLFPQGVEEEREGDEVVFAGYADTAPAAGLDAADVEPGWEDRWREYHRPVTVGRIWVGPPWCPQPADGARPRGTRAWPLRIVIDPGRAFGTGGHGSTRAALELLQRLDPCPALDLGCGSGVLALAAARLGHAPVLACDDDPDAVEVARENATRNNCDIQVWQCDALYDELPKAIDLWLANLQLAPLEELAWRPDLPARLIVSGLLEGEAFQPPGYRVAARRRRDGWEGLLLEREAAV